MRLRAADSRAHQRAELPPGLKARRRVCPAPTRRIQLSTAAAQACSPTEHGSKSSRRTFALQAKKTLSVVQVSIALFSPPPGDRHGRKRSQEHARYSPLAVAMEHAPTRARHTRARHTRTQKGPAASLRAGPVSRRRIRPPSSGCRSWRCTCPSRRSPCGTSACPLPIAPFG